jgi:hypothetical protein
MKSKLIEIALLALLAAGPLDAAVVAATYDRFTGKTTVKRDSVTSEIGKQPGLQILVGVKGEPDGTELVFASRSATGWQHFNYCDDVKWLVDGSRVDLGRAVHSNEPGTTAGVVEFIALRPGLAKVRQLAAADKVEVRICSAELQLSAREMGDLREFVRLMESPVDLDKEEKR